MELSLEKLLAWLRMMQMKTDTPPTRRHQAYYILNCYSLHRNQYRLMAQASAMCRDELQVPQPSPMSASLEQSSLVQCWGKQLEDAVIQFDIVPLLADFEAHPFEFFSNLPKDFQGRCDPETNLKAHNKLLAYERLGQTKVTDLTNRFGYHYIFRAGLREFFLTKLIVEHYNFMRLDHRGQEWRQRTQKTFYDLLDKFPNMKMEELRLYIRSTRAYPYDVLLFRNWLIRSRRAYYCMQTCITMMSQKNTH